MERYLTRIVLAAVGCSGSTRYQITEVDGFARPKITAEPTSYSWETMGGKHIRYPSAYRWPKRYISASRGVIVVGRGWLARKLAQQWHAQDVRRARRTLKLRQSIPHGIAHDYAIDAGRGDLAVLFRLIRQTA